MSAEDQERVRSLCEGRYEVVDFSKDRDSLVEQGENVEIVYGMVRPFELEQLPRLKWVQASWTGIENLLYPAMVESDVLVTCSKGHSSVPLAETALAAILYFARDFPGFPRGRWKKGWDEVERQRIVEGGQALVLGLGAIGEVVVEKLKALGVRCRAVTSTGAPEDSCSDVHTLETIREHLSDVDYCVNCLPGSEHTYRCVDDDFLGRLAPGAIFVNVGRGKTVDESALLRHLDSGHLSGALLDVTDPEPPEPDSPLLTHPRIICTGHRASFPMGDPEAAFKTFAENLQHWFAGESDRMRHKVDKRKGY
jgi:phosphoglycerate dehydrogenase-like enzyme